MQRWSFSRLFLAASIALTVASCDDSVLPAERGSADEVVGDQPRALVRSLADPLTVWVLLKEEASLTRAVSQNWTVRGREVVRELTTTASSTQAPLRDWLSARGIRFRSFWIVNAIKVTADRSLIAEIGRRPDVAKILPDRSYKLPPVHRGVPQRRVQSLEWGLSNVRAPEVWSAFGASGEGIVVANIDTGVQFDHPGPGAASTAATTGTAASTTTTTGSTRPSVCPRSSSLRQRALTAPTPWARWWATTASPGPTRSASRPGRGGSRPRAAERVNARSSP